MCFIATQESFGSKLSGVVLKQNTGTKQGKMKGNWLVLSEIWLRFGNQMMILCGERAWQLERREKKAA